MGLGVRSQLGETQLCLSGYGKENIIQGLRLKCFGGPFLKPGFGLRFIVYIVHTKKYTEKYEDGS